LVVVRLAGGACDHRTLNEPGDGQYFVWMEFYAAVSSSSALFAAAGRFEEWDGPVYIPIPRTDLDSSRCSL